MVSLNHVLINYLVIATVVQRDSLSKHNMRVGSNVKYIVAIYKNIGMVRRMFADRLMEIGTVPHNRVYTRLYRYRVAVWIRLTGGTRSSPATCTTHVRLLCYIKFRWTNVESIPIPISLHRFDI